MAALAVDMVGLKALARDLAKASDPRAGDLLKVMQQAGRAAAEPVAAAARNAIPHDSGTLSGNIRVTATRTGAGVRMGSKKVDYAGWVEFGGTRRQGPSDRSARPFDPRGRYLFPAAYGRQAEVLRLYNDALQRGIDRIRWTNPATATEAGTHD